MPNNMEDICLKHDNGDPLCFQGRLFSEGSHSDPETGAITRQQLYIAENGDQVYYIVRLDGHDRSRHAYRLRMNGDMCEIDNGRMEISLQFDMLMLAVRNLCGLGDGDTPSLEMVGDMLKAANS